MSLIDQPATPDVSEEIDRLDHDLQKVKSRRDGWSIAIFIASMMALALAAIFVGIGIGNLRSDGAGGSGAPSSITAALADYTITLGRRPRCPRAASSSSPTPGRCSTTWRCAAPTSGSTTSTPAPSATLDLSGLAPGSYELWCEVAGHEGLGMVTDLTVVAGSGDGTDDAAAMGMTADEHAAMADDGMMTAEEAAAMDQAMMDSIGLFPAATEGVGNQPLEPTILADGTKHYELTASIIDWEVSPGTIVKAWAYNGQVPGPRVDVEVGDTVEFEVTNQLQVGTDVHWHGIDVPFDQDGVAPITQELIASGETYTYRFTTTETGIGMYHAHTHGDLAVPNGMFGTFYVGEVPMPAGRTVSGIEIPADLNVAQDIPMVVNDAGEIGLSLNGKSFPATAPIVVDEGDWVKLTYFNEGLQVHPMHLHGFEQIVYAKDGEPLDAPYAADTILVGPGERYTVLFNASAAGTWVFHCHILTHVESSAGMFGMVTAVVVNPAGGA